MMKIEIHPYKLLYIVCHYTSDYLLCEQFPIFLKFRTVRCITLDLNFLRCGNVSVSRNLCL